jgi:hypothetical protein
MEEYLHGLLLTGKCLYVVQNQSNKIAVVRLNADLTTGDVNGTITDPALRVPTKLAGFGNSLYAVNAHFDTPPISDTEYEVVQLTRR